MPDTRAATSRGAGGPTVTLGGAGGGLELPRIGLGVFALDDASTAQIVCAALQAGYRGIDTAAIYGNEAGVGEGIRRSGVPRDQMVVTTKLWVDAHGVGPARVALSDSLRRLGLEQVDLYLVHWPHTAGGRWVEAWQGLQACQEEGLARAIGVSNFGAAHLDDLAAAGGPQPALNQVELHPYLTGADAVADHAARGVRTQSWSPLARGEVLAEPVIRRLSAGYDITPAQLVIAWQLAVVDATAVKTGQPRRLAENLAAADVVLEPEHVAMISALDRGTHVEDAYYQLA
ncbi:MAG: aldo/keto reductase [Cellulomonadaceae bacterium]|nr:aldo/keto reductase [Cellulomonadaceae bacterium]